MVIIFRILELTFSLLLIKVLTLLAGKHGHHMADSIGTLVTAALRTS